MKKRTVVFLSICGILLAAGALAIALLRHYTITTVYVEGSAPSRNEESLDMVMTGRLGNNSL